MFAQYFDRRFFELQEFIYHFNKMTAATNRNFHVLSSQINKVAGGNVGPLGAAIEQLSSFKTRRQEKRLSEELREHIT
jgi:hypothetical protein